MTKKKSNKAAKKTVGGGGKVLEFYLALVAWISGKFAQLTRDDIVGRYAIGQKVAALKADPDKYGKKSVENLADDLGRDKSTLYDYAAVAEKWTEDEIQELLDKNANVQGEPLTFSHLIEIASLTSKKTATKFLENTFSESLSHPQLRKAIKAKRRTKSEDPIQDAKIEEEKARSVFDGIRHMKGGLDGVLSQLRNWDQTVLQGLEAISSEADAWKDRASIDAVRVSLVEVRAACDAAVEKLEQLLSGGEASSKNGQPPAKKAGGRKGAKKKVQKKTSKVKKKAGARGVLA